MVLRIMRRFDSYSPIEDCGSPLVGLTTNKAIEFIETGMRRPPIEGPGHRNFPGWRFVIFPKGCCAVAILTEHSGQWRYTIGTDTRVARKSSSQLHDGSGIVCVGGSSWVGCGAASVSSAAAVSATTDRFLRTSNEKLLIVRL